MYALGLLHDLQTIASLHLGQAQTTSVEERLCVYGAAVESEDVATTFVRQKERVTIGVVCLEN